MEFDPYYKWLGIPPQEQPAHHYRLLGISLFEADPEVIDAAYYRQMAYVRNCAVGPNSDLSQKILNELSAARICLLDPKQKAAYDQVLKARQPAAPTRDQLASTTVVTNTLQPVATHLSVAVPFQPAPVLAVELASFLPQDADRRRTRRSTKRRLSRFIPSIAFALVGLVIGGALFVIWIRSTGPAMSLSKHTSPSPQQPTAARAVPLAPTPSAKPKGDNRGITSDKGETVVPKVAVASQPLRSTAQSLTPAKPDGIENTATTSHSPLPANTPLPADTQPLKKSQLPSRQAQSAAANLLKSLPPATADQWFEKATEANDSDRSFAMLEKSRFVAVASGDIAAAVRAVDEMDRCFILDPTATRIETLQQLHGHVRSTDDFKLLAETTLLWFNGHSAHAGSASGELLKNALLAAQKSGDDELIVRVRHAIIAADGMDGLAKLTDELRRGEVAGSPAVAKKSKTTELILAPGVKMKFRLIPTGTFTMGRPRDTGNLFEHTLNITQPFYIGITEVTQAQWLAVMGKNPSLMKGDLAWPVDTVSWNDCQDFVRRLNQSPLAKGYRFRLPTEAEWEYACRAGTTTEYCFGDDAKLLPQYGWFKDNSGGAQHAVARLKPNAWGLYDMHGGAWEWCGDWYADDYYKSSPDTDPTGPATGEKRILRGGARTSTADECGSPHRYAAFPDTIYPNFALRVVCQ